MIGRSSRSKGMQRGSIITVDTQSARSGKSINEVLEAREKIDQMDEGP